MSEEKRSFIEGYIIMRKHKNGVIPKRVLKDLKIRVVGMTVSQSGRPIGEIEEAKVDSEGLRVKIRLQDPSALCDLHKVHNEKNDGSF